MSIFSLLKFIGTSPRQCKAKTNWGNAHRSIQSTKAENTYSKAHNSICEDRDRTTYKHLLEIDTQVWTPTQTYSVLIKSLKSQSNSFSEGSQLHYELYLKIILRRKKAVWLSTLTIARRREDWTKVVDSHPSQQRQTFPLRRANSGVYQYWSKLLQYTKCVPHQKQKPKNPVL